MSSRQGVFSYTIMTNQAEIQLKINTIADSVKNELHKRNVSKSRLSELTGLSINTIHNLVNGRNCTIKTLIAVSEAIKVDPVIFFDTSTTLTEIELTP